MSNSEDAVIEKAPSKNSEVLKQAMDVAAKAQKSFETAAKNSPGGQKNPNQAYHGLEVIVASNEHNSFMARWTLMALIFSFVVVIVLSGVVFVLVTKETKILAFQMDEEGRTIQVQPLSNPLVTDVQLTAWANKRMYDLHSFSFTGYRQELQDVRPHFLEPAFQEFQQALRSSGIIAKIKEKALVVSSAPTRAPTITSKKVVNGRMQWIVTNQIIQTIEGGGVAPVSNRLKVMMKIVRVPRTKHLDGVRIQSYLVKG